MIGPTSSRAARLGVTLVALLLAACGGGGDAGPTPTSFGVSAGPVPSAPLTPPAAAAGPSGAPPTEAPAFATRRARLVQTAILGAGIQDPAVVEAMARVPRHRFVPARFRDQAYEDHPLPIGYGQTISQPYIVALMTQALDLAPGDKVLEIGTGSGYQAAVLAEIAAQVYTIEIIGALAERAEATLQELGYANVRVRHGDGYYGWPEEAPFDAIIVTAAPDHVPPPLKAQLADGARLVIPVGPVGGYQELWQIERHGDRFKTTSLGGVVFVPLTREKRP